MDKPINDGGPAFARPYSRDPQHYCDPESYPSQEGMTLRDYFAGQALIGLLGRPVASFDSLAKDATQIADATIKALSKGGA